MTAPSSPAPLPADVRTLATTAWWLVLVQGLLAIVFGVVAIVWPSLALETILVLFGAYSLLDGVVSLYAGIRNRDQGWGWLVFQGIASLAIGVLALRYPSTTAIALTLIVAFWALVIGFIRIWGAFELRRLRARGWAWALIAGILAAVFGLALVVNPGYGAQALMWLIAITALVFGLALVINAALVRKVVEDLADDGVLNDSNA